MQVQAQAQLQAAGTGSLALAQVQVHVLIKHLCTLHLMCSTLECLQPHLCVCAVPVCAAIAYAIVLPQLQVVGCSH